MKAIKSAIIIATLALSGAAFGQTKQGEVGGTFNSTVDVKKVNLRNQAVLGTAQQELNVGSVKGGKVSGNVTTNVKTDEINMRNQAVLGTAQQEVNLGSVK
jgi:hypothetical protein